MRMTFSAPSMNENGPKVADLAGKLLIITPTDYKTGIKTIHGDAEAVEVSLVNLDDNKNYDGVLFFNVALRNSLKQKIGQKVLARIGQGTAKPGKSAPWILLDATTDAAALAKANAYLSVAPVATAPAAAPALPAANGSITPEVAALLAQLGAKQEIILGSFSLPFNCQDSKCLVAFLGEKLVRFQHLHSKTNLIGGGK